MWVPELPSQPTCPPRGDPCKPTGGALRRVSTPVGRDHPPPLLQLSPQSVEVHPAGEVGLRVRVGPGRRHLGKGMAKAKSKSLITCSRRPPAAVQLQQGDRGKERGPSCPGPHAHASLGLRGWRASQDDARVLSTQAPCPWPPPSLCDYFSSSRSPPRGASAST